MTDLLRFFDINSTFFTVIGYPMSYIEFFGTLFTIWCVWLTAKAKVLSWPIGIVGTVLYFILFYQIHLYSDLIEQAYFLVTGLIGWWAWTHAGKNDANAEKDLKVKRNTLKENALYVGIIAVGTLVLTYVVMRLNVWLPAYFPEPASLPLLDAFTTVMSFVAQWLLVRKRVESWVLWIIVDVIAVGLYWYKDVKFISLEYVLFCFIAVAGLLKWLKLYRADHKLV